MRMIIYFSRCLRMDWGWGVTLFLNFEGDICVFLAILQIITNPQVLNNEWVLTTLSVLISLIIGNIKDSGRVSQLRARHKLQLP